MQRSDLRLQLVLRQSGLDPRNEVTAIRVVIGVLELASAALGKVPAGRILMVRSRREGAVVHEGVPGNAEGYVAAG